MNTPPVPVLRLLLETEDEGFVLRLETGAESHRFSLTAEQLDVLADEIEDALAG